MTPHDSRAPDPYLKRWAKEVALPLLPVALVGAAFALGVLIKKLEEVDAERVPARLPLAVQKIARSVVKVEANSTLSIGESGSGAKIGPDTVLTAGHVFLKGNPKKKLDCRSSLVLNAKTPRYWQGEKILGEDAQDTLKLSGEFYKTGQDIAVLRVRPDRAFASLPTARIAKHQPSAGQTVYFVNYESNGEKSKVDRYPNTALAHESPITKNTKNYSYPAEYAGTVLGQAGALLAIVTGEKAYGNKRGSIAGSHPGASGGPGIDDQGEVFGEVVRTGTMSNSELNYYFNNVKLPKDHRSEHQITLVQPVTAETLGRYALAINPTCAG